MGWRHFQRKSAVSAFIRNLVFSPCITQSQNPEFFFFFPDRAGNAIRFMKERKNGSFLAHAEKFVAILVVYSLEKTPSFPL